MKGAARFATGLADTTFGNQFASYLDSARLGESAAAQSGSFGTSAGQSIGNNLIGAGNAAAGGTVGAANAAAGGLSGIGNSFLLYQLLNGGGGGWRPACMAGAAAPHSWSRRLMPDVNGSIPASVQVPQNDLFGTVGKALAVKQGLLQNQMLQQDFAARQGAGQAYQASIDPNVWRSGQQQDSLA
jgi:hypothetical protein